MPAMPKVSGGRICERRSCERCLCFCVLYSICTYMLNELAVPAGAFLKLRILQCNETCTAMYTRKRRANRSFFLLFFSSFTEHAHMHTSTDILAHRKHFHDRLLRVSHKYFCGKKTSPIPAHVRRPSPVAHSLRNSAPNG